jgi:hypothetical protein
MNNEQPSEKKKWVKPELTVLVRNKPEEQVLSGCKTLGGNGGNNSGSTNNDCIQTLYPPDVPLPAVCGAGACSSITSS